MSNFKNNTAQLQELLAKANALPSNNQYLDELNEITGGASAMTMRSAINNAETEVSEQNELIKQIQNELSTRAVSGGNSDDDVIIGIQFFSDSAGNQYFDSWDIELLKGDTAAIFNNIFNTQKVNVGIYIGFMYGGAEHYQYVCAKTVEECWYGSYGWVQIFFDNDYFANRRYRITMDPYGSIPLYMDFREI